MNLISEIIADEGQRSVGGPGGLLQELEALTRYVVKVRSDLAAVGPAALRRTHIPKAADQLDAVVEATEVAANQIMDACDLLENVASEIAPDQAKRIRDGLTLIYEACGFQDLTGQRIVTVTNTLAFIEEKLADLMLMLGIPIDECAEHELGHAPSQTADGDRLLNGPQLPGSGIDQAQIDALLAGLLRTEPANE